MYRLNQEDNKGIAIGRGAHRVKSKWSIDIFNSKSFTLSGMSLSNF